MSFLRNIKKILVYGQGSTRGICATHLRRQTAYDEHDCEDGLWVDEDPKDRSEVIDVETSIRYVNSEAFKQAYGGELIWTLYRRNRISPFLRDTRKRCIRSNTIKTASPCPICRDMYLVLDHRNVKLLEQFISPYSGEILPTMKTGLCQMQHQKLIIAVMRAKEFGTLSFHVPFRHYDYNYYKKMSQNLLKQDEIQKIN